MKSLKDFIANYKIDEDIDGMPGVFSSKPADPPPTLVMRRRSIREFPNGQRVALYQIDKLNKYITIPYQVKNWANEEVELQLEPLEENVMHHLKNIVNNSQAKSVKFKDGSSMKVDVQTANAILKVHGAVNDENKEKISQMAHKSKSHFKKVADFAWKHVTYKTKD